MKLLFFYLILTTSFVVADLTDCKPYYAAADPPAHVAGDWIGEGMEAQVYQWPSDPKFVLKTNLPGGFHDGVDKLMVGYTRAAKAGLIPEPIKIEGVTVNDPKTGPRVVDGILVPKVEGPTIRKAKADNLEIPDHVFEQFRKELAACAEKGMGPADLTADNLAVEKDASGKAVKLVIIDYGQFRDFRHVPTAKAFNAHVAKEFEDWYRGRRKGEP